MPNITNELIEKTSRPVAGKQLILRDDVLPCFAVRLTANCASFIVEKRVKGSVGRITLGQYGTSQGLTSAAARELAAKTLAEMAAGNNPRPAKLPTLTEVLEKFLEMRNLRSASVRHYRAVLNRCMGDWLDLRIDKITTHANRTCRRRRARASMSRWLKEGADVLNILVERMHQLAALSPGANIRSHGCSDRRKMERSTGFR